MIVEERSHEPDNRQTINHYITYSVISSQPALSYTSVLSTIRVYPVTSGDLEGSTFIEWTGSFSSDADAGTSCACPSYSLANRNVGVIQDAKFKRREALADLAKTTGKK